MHCFAGPAPEQVLPECSGGGQETTAAEAAYARTRPAKEVRSRTTAELPRPDKTGAAARRMPYRAGFSPQDRRLGTGVPTTHCNPAISGHIPSNPADAASVSFADAANRVRDAAERGVRSCVAGIRRLGTMHKARPNGFGILAVPDAEFREAAESGRGFSCTDAALDGMAGSARRGAKRYTALDAAGRRDMPEGRRGGPVRAADPCWSGETRILTRSGPVSFRDLTGGPSKVKVMTREEDGTLSYRTMENPGMTKQAADVVCLVVESKLTGECAALRCTPDHRVYVVSASGVERRAVADLTPGTSLASLYLDGSMWEQTVGVSASVSDIPERAMRGTGHPAPGILPLSLAAKKGRQKKRQATAEGFVAADGSIPEVRAAKKPGLLSRLLGRSRSGNHAVLAVIRIGKTDVYNGMVETTHNYFVECGEGHYILSGNCGGRAFGPVEYGGNPVRLAECVGGAPDWGARGAGHAACRRVRPACPSGPRRTATCRTGPRCARAPEGGTAAGKPSGAGCG